MMLDGFVLASDSLEGDPPGRCKILRKQDEGRVRHEGIPVESG